MSAVTAGRMQGVLAGIAAFGCSNTFRHRGSSSVLGVAGLCVALAACLLPENHAWADGLPDAADYAFVQKPGDLVPGDLLFREADGRVVHFGDLPAGKPLVVALGYFHCPSLCSVVRDDLLAALGRSGKVAGLDYELAVVSIDPAETSADAAIAKGDDRERYPATGSGDAWHFLTGNQGAVAALSAAVGFTSRYDIHLRQFLHPAGIVVLTPERRVSGYVLGVGYKAGDVGAALTEAETGTIAKAALPILLVCFHFDAATGRYSLEVMKVLRLGAAITVVGLALGIVLLWRGGRRNKAAS